MNNSTTIKSNNTPLRLQIIEFCWQHLWLLISLYIMTLGVALCVRSNLGSSVISSIPMAFAIAGADNLAPQLTIGGYTNLMNILLVGLQIAILRRRFEKIQLLQLIIGFLFGMLIDLNMAITSTFSYDTVANQITAQIAGCTIMAIGIAMEIRCGSVTMPGEGIQVALAQVCNTPFAKMKIRVDITLVALAIAFCYYFWGAWQWNIIGPGTLFAMIYVGYCVKLISKHLSWFDRTLGYRPGFRRYIFGLARFILPGKE